MRAVPTRVIPPMPVAVAMPVAAAVNMATTVAVTVTVTVAVAVAVLRQHIMVLLARLVLRTVTVRTRQEGA